MSLGEKISNLRKREAMSQEELSEKVGVARQTISKWELDETAPDIKQAQELSQIFHISLDELVGNELSSVVVEKISNTEKLAGMIIKILKVAGIILLVMVIIEIVALITAVFFFRPISKEETTKGSISCIVGDNKYVIEVESNGMFTCQNCDAKLSSELEQLIDFNNYVETRNNIMDYFEEQDIECELKEY